MSTIRPVKKKKEEQDYTPVSYTHLYEKTEPVTEEKNVGDREPLVSIKENIGDWRLIGQAKTVFAELKQNMAQQDYKMALETARKLIGYLEQIGTEEVPE